MNVKRFELKANKSEFKRVKIISSNDSYNFMKEFFSDDIEVFESVFILLLDRSNKTIGFAKISQGGVCGSYIDVKIIAKYCIDSLCSGCIIAHNHPSGNLTPSESDKLITRKVKDSLMLLDATLLDHLIITNESYYSFCDEGLL